jgi:hypothetical protein
MQALFSGVLELRRTPLKPAKMIVHNLTTDRTCLARHLSRTLMLTWFQGRKSLLCPACQSDSPRRSRRRSVKDHIVGATLLRPWRCRSCNLRFYAWAAPVRYVTYVHCGMCGNMDLQRISSEHGAGMFAWVFRLLRCPTYRCAPCRNRFFSFRSYRRIVPVDHPIVTTVESDPVAQ